MAPGWWVSRVLKSFLVKTFQRPCETLEPRGAGKFGPTLGKDIGGVALVPRGRKFPFIPGLLTTVPVFLMNRCSTVFAKR